MRTLATLLGLAALCSAGLAGATTVRTLGPDRSVVVLDLTASKDDAAQARALTAILSANLAKQPGVKLVTSDDVRQLLGVERQKQLLGCTDDSCMAEVGGALGARYILSGQLARFGSQLLLTAGLVDAHTARSVVKTAKTVETAEQLPAAAQAIALEVARGMGIDAEEAEPPYAPTLGLDVKLGDTLPTLTGANHPALDDFNLRFDLELDYYATRNIVPFVVASLVLARARSDDSLHFIPVLLGCKYVFRAERTLRPYVGLGVGLGFLFGESVGGDGTRASVALNGLAGLAYFPWRRVGFNVEASANYSGVSVSETSGVLLAFNANFGVMFLFF